MARKKKEITPETVVDTISNETEQFLKDCAVGAANSVICNLKMFRDENGFLKGVEYKFKEDGTIDYKAMIPDEFIGLNKEIFKRRNIDVFSLSKEEFDALKAKAPDTEKIIKLAGIKYLALLRGYTKMEVNSKPLESRAVADSSITWIPNKECEFREVTTPGTGTYFYNPHDKMRHFMDSIAENRAICRNVRNALNIPIVSDGELSNESGSAPEQEENTYATIPEPLNLLKNALQSAGWTFEQMKARLLAKPKEGDDVEEIKGWNCLEDISKAKCSVLTERIKKYLADKKTS